ncbi:MAG: DUF1631 family protein [Burkholderiales bacterium]|nr:DUF1631 family protein [Burkholderiales bacterium]
MPALTTGGRPLSAVDPEPLPRMGVEESRALLRACFAQYRLKLIELIKASFEQMGDLFETHSAIPDGEIEQFRMKRSEWLERFDKTLCDLFEKRVVDGARRKGRRPDADASLATLRVLTAFDHDRQTALKDATRFLDRFTQREIAALDLRVEALLGDPGPRDIDNPFSVAYILDAVGSSARAVYPNPRVWRPFMERVLSDLTPEINKLYISLNRFLADRGVLPEIKAALRARSEFRPYDDRELLPTFSKMMHDALPDVPRDIEVPDNLADPNAPPALVFAERNVVHLRPGEPDPHEMSAAKILAGLAALATAAPGSAGAGGPMVIGGAPVVVGLPGAAAPPADPSGFPSLDPLMALGTSTPLFATLAHWQRLDLPTAIAQAAPKTTPGSSEGTVVPLNLIPHIRAAIEGQIGNDTDRITMDVIALLFDYIFRDRSIPDAMRSLFGRLQVPIVKAAVLDRTFFSDRKHSARQLLDNLAEAAVGATHDAAYQDAFAALATEIVESICRDFEIDVAVFRTASARLAAFIEAERQKVSSATTEDVAAALVAEQGEADRSHVRAFLRDRLAGLDVPFEVRGFIETTWADHMAQLRRQHGDQSEEWNKAVATLDDLLWSIVAKERTGQKARLTKMIPSLIGALRKGCTALGVPPERGRLFFESLYQLHIAAIKSVTSAAPAPGAPAKPREQPPIPATNVYDYVSEMAVGTWLAFAKEGNTVNARLTWVSPLRTKYLFTSRSRARAFVYTPEELAYEIGAGEVTLVVEPVPLFDRAVSAALNTLGARQPAPAAAAPA